MPMVPFVSSRLTTQFIPFGPSPSHPRMLPNLDSAPPHHHGATASNANPISQPRRCPRFLPLHLRPIAPNLLAPRVGTFALTGARTCCHCRHHTSQPDLARSLPFQPNATVPARSINHEATQCAKPPAGMNLTSQPHDTRSWPDACPFVTLGNLQSTPCRDIV